VTTGLTSNHWYSACPACGRVLSIWATAPLTGPTPVQWVENNGGDQQWRLVQVTG
jgi:hypothetical protein